MEKKTVNIAEHLEKWGCNNIITRASVVELLRFLGHDVKDGEVEINITNTPS
jgi:hypothetical protein